MLPVREMRCVKVLLDVMDLCLVSVAPRTSIQIAIAVQRCTGMALQASMEREMQRAMGSRVG